MTSDRKSYQAVLATPFGGLGFLLQGEKLRRIDLLFGDWEPKRGLDHRADRVASMIAAYLRDPTVALEPVIDTKGTPFQQRVWQRLRRIPPGSVLTYGSIARELHTSPRAVGNACRTNPCPLVVPCHRVVGARGLGGFAGQQGGEKLAVKRWLLTHEGVPLEQE